VPLERHGRSPVLQGGEEVNYLHQYQRGGAGEPALGAAATAATHGFSIRAAQAAIFGGWARAAAGDGDGDGVDELRAGLDAYLATGAELDHPYYLGLLGDAVARTAGLAEGLAVLEEAVELVGTARPFYYLPELHRLRGDLLAADGRPAEAADAYRRAMELAAGHGTRSAELRAAIGLCRLPEPARPAGALAELRRLHDQFEEGFGTPDLLAARALLEAG
jgi:predicted ATPase